MKRNVLNICLSALLCGALFSCGPLHEIGLSAKRHNTTLVKANSQSKPLPVREKPVTAEAQPAEVPVDVSTTPVEQMKKEASLQESLLKTGEEVSPAPAKPSRALLRKTLKKVIAREQAQVPATGFSTRTENQVADNEEYIAPADMQKQETRQAPPSDRMVLEIILALLLPPLAVYVHEGNIGTNFWINLILTLLLVIPGIIHALLVVTNTIRRL
jgi:uncharacterized membrane protein YqaE (UPF0057 family)